MAQPAPTNLNLSTLWSDGNGQGPTRPGYTQITRQDPAYAHYIRVKLTNHFNSNPELVRQHGQYSSCIWYITATLLTRKPGLHQFFGDLPHGYTLWTHVTPGETDVEEPIGHPGDYFRSAKRFSGHVGEMLTANSAEEQRIRAEIDADNQSKASEAIVRQNQESIRLWRLIGQKYVWFDHNDYAAGRALITPRVANAEISADRQTNRTIAIPCSCVFR